VLLNAADRPVRLRVATPGGGEWRDLFDGAAGSPECGAQTLAATVPPHDLRILSSGR
jgi:hypothetical protein